MSDTLVVPEKKSVLIFVGYYFPGSKAGGPIRSILGITEKLGDTYNFCIVTRDRDLGDRSAFEGVVVGEWTQVRGNNVYYVKMGVLALWSIARIAIQHKADIVYLNSVFSFPFSIWIAFVMFCSGTYRKQRILIAPRGEFGTAALKKSAIRKKIFLGLARRFRIYRLATWHASSVYEKEDVVNAGFGLSDYAVARPFKTDALIVASDLSEAPKKGLSSVGPCGEKKAGRLRLVFMARIVPIKNLEYLLKILPQLRGDIILDIYGPVEDRVYWSKCCDCIKCLPSWANVRYMGHIEHAAVPQTLVMYDAYVLPSAGENFGHGILEALLSGLPVVISDRTFWRGLAAVKAGWDLPLRAPSGFVEVLQKLCAMDNEEYQLYSRMALMHGQSAVDNIGALEENRNMFSRVLSAPN